MQLVKEIQIVMWIGNRWRRFSPRVDADIWEFLTDSVAIDTSALRFTVTYGGTGNDTYADNISASVNAIPEPGSFAVLGLAGLGFTLVRRKR